MNETDLQKLLNQHFNLSEIRQICFELKIDYENLEGETKTIIIISLIEYCKRHGLYEVLVASIAEKTARLSPKLIWKTTGQLPLIIFLILSTISVGLVIFVYWLFKDTYLINMWVVILVIVFLLLTIVTWMVYVSQKKWRTKLLVAIGIILPLIVLITTIKQVWSILYPKQFESQVLGIVLAEIGQIRKGGKYGRTIETQDLTNQIYESLCETIRKSFIEQTLHPCRDIDIIPDPRQVVVRRAGVMSNSEMAEDLGRRFNADLIVWGLVTDARNNEFRFRFQILETLNEADNPDFPLILPVTAKFADIVYHRIDLSKSTQSEFLIVNQARTISSLILGLVYFTDRNYSEAINYLELAVSDLKDSESLSSQGENISLIYYYLGKSYQAIGQNAEAMTQLLTARSLNHDEPSIPLSLAYIYRSTNEHAEMAQSLNEAKEILDQRLSAQPDDFRAYYDRGILHILNAHLDLAIGDFRDAIVLKPDFYIAYISLGESLARAGQLHEAEEELLKAIELSNMTGANPASALIRLANVLWDQDRLDEADETYKMAILAAPEVHYIYYQYADFLVQNKHYEQAVEVLDELISLTLYKGDVGGIYQAAGNLYRETQQWQKAANYYENAVRHESENGLSHALLAEAYYNLGRIEDSIRVYKLAIEKEENNYYIYSSYGITLYKVGKFVQSAEMLEKSITLRPIAPEELKTLSTIYAVLGECEKEQNVYERIFSQFEQFPDELVAVAEQRMQNLPDCGIPEG